MAKQILKNTAHELAVKVLTDASGPTTITLADGLFSGVTPSGYSIKALYWTGACVNGNGGAHLELKRTNGVDPDILIYELCSNGSLNLISLADSLYADTHPELLVESSLPATHHYTLIVHLSKIA